MDLETICQRVFQKAFAQAVDLCVPVAYINMHVRSFPFDINDFRETFRKYVRNTPLSNVDLDVSESEDIEEGLIILDSLEEFADEDNDPEVIPFHEVLREIRL
ncbi:MAG: hypothetical protein J6B81_03810 [Spirochaetaceae bacterium]|nr:hypothetical protein [Spirochaetaceae bacterium]